MLSRLLDDDRLAGDHWEGLRHPGLSLDVALLRVRSGVLVDECLVWIVAASGHWKSLDGTGRVLLGEGTWTLVRVGIGRAARLVWRATRLVRRSSRVAVGRLVDWDRYTRPGLIG
jgi:hypothetical protein